jgi:hypothetical protein
VNVLTFEPGIQLGRKCHYIYNYHCISRVQLQALFTLRQVHEKSHLTEPPSTVLRANMQGHDLKLLEQGVAKLRTVVRVQNGGATKVDKDGDELLRHSIC